MIIPGVVSCLRRLADKPYSPPYHRSAHHTPDVPVILACAALAQHTGKPAKSLAGVKPAYISDAFYLPYARHKNRAGGFTMFR